MSLKRRSNVRIWLQADLQSPEIDFRFTPESGHSRVDNKLGHENGAQLTCIPESGSARCNSSTALVTRFHTA